MASLFDSFGAPASPMLSTPTRSGAMGTGDRVQSLYATPTRGGSFGVASNSASGLLLQTSPSATPERQVLSDRFIPDRGSQDLEISRFILKENATPLRSSLGGSVSGLVGGTAGASGAGGAGAASSGLLSSGSFGVAMGGNSGVVSGGGGASGARCPDFDEVPAVCEEPYVAALSRTLFQDATQNSVLGMHSTNDGNLYMPESARYERSLGVIYNENRLRNFKSRTFRVIPQTPERILDAPELLDDFYLNLLDWSALNIMTVALGNTVYLWNADTGSITQLYTCAEQNNIVTSVAFHGDGRVLAIGTHEADVQLWDTEAQKLLRTIKGHTARVGSMHWSGDVIASGSRDTTVRIHDIRDANVAQVHQGHTQEVCGIRWSPSGTQLATGGNDNLLNIWDFRHEPRQLRPMFTFRSHKAAIKAIAWNPVRPNLLASGGGTADKTLKFWNTATGSLLHSVDTKSQVCGVLWSKAGNELVSSHGYQDNQLTLWKYPSLKRTTDLTGHNSRVLHLAMSPDGQIVVSAAGDETIRFWRCFGAEPSSPQAPPSPAARKASTPSKHRQEDMSDFLDEIR